jgi:hypothetical protein
MNWAKSRERKWGRPSWTVSSASSVWGNDLERLGWRASPLQPFLTLRSWDGRSRRRANLAKRPGLLTSRQERHHGARNPGT